MHMRGSKQDVPVVFEEGPTTIRQIEWGGMNVEIGAIGADMDIAPLFQGLPDNQCQCPHWGYVIKGRLIYRSGDREEVFNAGDVYHVGPGHLPVFEAGTEYVEFSPADELAKTMAVVERNLTAMQARGT
jgi:hypothetical protein